MNTLRKCVLIAAMSFCSSAFANTYIFDQTDLWWNANESGWGVTVTHQQDVIFLTFFVYGPDGRAAWYTGQGTYQNVGADGTHVYTGSMYQVAGPWFGASFNPALVNARLVGTMRFAAFVNAATLTYSIDGVSVTKQITRQTLRLNIINTIYHGTAITTQSGCNPASLNGTYTTNTTVGVINTDTTLRMVSIGSGINPPNTCTYTGDYEQTGRIGLSRGVFSCNTGASGTYTATGIDANGRGITARLAAVSNACSSVSTVFGGANAGIWVK